MNNSHFSQLTNPPQYQLITYTITPNKHINMQAHNGHQTVLRQNLCLFFHAMTHDLQQCKNHTNHNTFVLVAKRHRVLILCIQQWVANIYAHKAWQFYLSIIL